MSMCLFVSIIIARSGDLGHHEFFIPSILVSQLERKNKQNWASCFNSCRCSDHRAMAPHSHPGNFTPVIDNPIPKLMLKESTGIIKSPSIEHQYHVTSRLSLIWVGLELRCVFHFSRSLVACL